MALSLQRDVPNGNAMLDPSKVDPRTYDRRIGRLLGAHPDRVRYYCRILEKLAKHYDDPPDFEIGLWDLDLAARLDRNLAGCLHRTVQASAATAATQRLWAKVDDA